MQANRRSFLQGLVGRASLAGCAASLIATQPGCLGVVANLAHAVGADMIPAEYTELEDSTVAIVTVTEQSIYSQDPAARTLSDRVGEILLRKVDDVALVRQDQLMDWRDTNGWENTDFAEIGRGLKADQVIGIELHNLRLRDGATLYRGRSDAVVTVHDVETGNIVYRKEFDDFTYPVTTGQYTSETTEARFRKLYLGMLAQRIARCFHPWDKTDDFALDGMIASQ
ncbi:MAG: hypothetical protein AAGA03_04395 [Planctomycetota bacterium]